MPLNNDKLTLRKALKIVYFKGNRRINILQISPSVYNFYEDKPAVEYGEALDYLYMQHRFVYHVTTFLIFPYKRHQFIDKVKKMMRFSR